MKVKKMESKLLKRVVECAKFNNEKRQRLELLGPIAGLDSGNILYVGFFDKESKLGSYLESLSREKRRNKIWDMIIDNAYSRANMQFKTSDLYLSFKKNARILKSSDYEDNDYYRDIKFDKEIKIGRYILTKERFLRGEIMTYDIGDVLEYNICVPKLGIWEDNFDYPILIEDTNVWMSITPNEIHTMEEPINNAHGRVLTFGLGLGYFAYMASLKESVTSITIVEKSQEVIDIFNKVILPQFKTKDKIDIIHADMFDYIEEHDIDKEFDYMFVDIWKDCMQVYLYLKCRKALENIKDIQIDYWISKEIDYLLLDETLVGYMEFLMSRKVEKSSSSIDNSLALFKVLNSVFRDNDDLDIRVDFLNVDKVIDKLLSKM